MFAEDEIIRGHADIFGFHDFIGLAVGQNPVLMNAALMGEGIFTDNGFIARDGIARNGREKFRGRIKTLRLNICGGVEEIFAGPQGHDGFL